MTCVPLRHHRCQHDGLQLQTFFFGSAPDFLEYTRPMIFHELGASVRLVKRKLYVKVEIFSKATA